MACRSSQIHVVGDKIWKLRKKGGIICLRVLLGYEKIRRKDYEKRIQKI